MIRELRRAHRLATTALAVAVPAVIVLGTLRARAVDYAGEIPAPLAATAGGVPPGAPDAGGLEFAPGLRVARDGRAIAIRAEPAGGAPDVLFYWSPGPDAEPMRLPDDALFLGRLTHGLGASLELPAAQGGADGTLIAFSLGLGEVIGSARLAASASSPASAGGAR